MPDLLRKRLGPMADDQELIAGSCLIEIVPEADLFAYTPVASIVVIDGRGGLNARLRAPDDVERALGRPVADVERTWREFTQDGCVPEE